MFVFSDRRNKLTDTSVVDFKSKNAYPVLFAFAFLGLFAFFTGSGDFDTGFYCGNKIVVAAYVGMYFSAGHSDIVVNVGV